jgi:hypothetical protein
MSLMAVMRWLALVVMMRVDESLLVDFILALHQFELGLGLLPSWLYLPLHIQLLLPSLGFLHTSILAYRLSLFSSFFLGP